MRVSATFRMRSGDGLTSCLWPCPVSTFPRSPHFLSAIYQILKPERQLATTGNDNGAVVSFDKYDCARSSLCRDAAAS